MFSQICESQSVDVPVMCGQYDILVIDRGIADIFRFCLGTQMVF